MKSILKLTQKDVKGMKICTEDHLVTKESFYKRLCKDLKSNKIIYIMLIPVVLYYLIFCYWPMYGITIAFKDFKPALGILGSPWVGLENFIEFFNSAYFIRTLKNTLLISFYSLIFGFPAPIIFAIFLNELKSKYYKKTIQTITYLPHFLSMVIICGLILQFTNSTGFITKIVNAFTSHEGSLIADPNCFRTIYVASDIWAGFGWGSIIYLAAMMGINQELYEAASIDGAGKFRQMWHVTLPGITPTIIIMFILAVGNLMGVGWEKTFLLQTPLTYETSDIISTFVYRKGFQDMDYGYSTAVGLFNSIINCMLIIIANAISRKFSETSLW